MRLRLLSFYITEREDSLAGMELLWDQFADTHYEVQSQLCVD